MEQRGRARLKDVAASVGLSSATVSIILNEASDRFPPATVQRVREAAATLGYTPNVAARSLRTNSTRTLGVLTDNILTSPSGYDMVQGLQDAAWDRDYVLLFVGTEGDPTQQTKAIAELLARQVDGMLVGAMYHRLLDAGRLPGAVPTVGFNAVLDGVGSFVPDDVQAGRLATQILLEHGHRRIAHITEYPTDGLARDQRVEGFQAALREAGLPPGRVIDPGPEHPASASESAEGLALPLLDAPDRPTAIFTFNDLDAVGVFRATQRLGLRIPDDVSVISIDNRENVAEELRPGLTTLALPHYELGRRATDRLLDAIDGGTPIPTDVVKVPFTVVSRGSVGVRA
ncbi:MAG TPA: LacI family DNA-binding transcriptional regulator [Arachnia sp.]|nr:LacI family DNA-binding transcriptional regulator [Arachnia sp.]